MPIGQEWINFNHAEQVQFDMLTDPDVTAVPALRFRVLGPDGASNQTLEIVIENDREGIVRDPATVETFVRAMASAYLSGSVEKTCNVQRLRRATGDGAYCLLTDASLVSAPERQQGQFRYVLFGAIKIGGRVLTAVAYSNSKVGADFEALLDVLTNIDIGKTPRVLENQGR